MSSPVSPRISMPAVWSLMIERCNAAEIAAYFNTSQEVAKKFMAQAAKTAREGRIETEAAHIQESGGRLMNGPKKFTFENEELTVKEIMKRVPVLSEYGVRRHLAAGRNTVSAMLSYRPPPPPKPKREQGFVIGPKSRPNWKHRPS